MTEELAKIARSAQIELLAYLLDIAALEAKTVAGRGTRRRRQSKASGEPADHPDT